VLRPALEQSGIATVVGHKTVRRRGKDIEVPIYDYHGVAFHAFRKAAGSLLLANGKTLKQVQGWLRHSQLTTTMNVYITQVDNGLGSADVWDDILPGGPRSGPTDTVLTAGGPEGGPEGGFEGSEETAAESETPKHGP
jgi:site-specific recombinase XerC